jgi:hypothetical protein
MKRFMTTSCRSVAIFFHWQVADIAADHALRCVTKTSILPFPGHVTHPDY